MKEIQEFKTETDIVRYNEIKESIDIHSASSTLKYGIEPMESISKFSETLLVGVKANENVTISNHLGDLVTSIKGYLPEDINKLKPVGFFGRFFGMLSGNKPKSPQEVLDQRFQSVSKNVDEITSQLDHSMIGLLTDNDKLEDLYLQNMEFYIDVDMYVRAGKEKIKEVKETELKLLQDQSSKSTDMVVVQKTKDLIDNINRFERRIQDLEISKSIAMQTAPQIRIIQNNNQHLAEKIQGSILTTIPIWKSQIVLSKTLEDQHKAVKLQKEVSDTTNDLLKYNASLLQQNSITVAQESERSIVDIETIRDVQDKLVNTIEETMRIATDARKKRQDVEIELSQMEDNLRKRITTVVENNR